MKTPNLIQVIPTDDFIVYLYYDDGSVRIYNALQLLKRGGAFAILNDINVFLYTCTIMNDTLAWDIAGGFDEWNCIDICPDTLLECPIVENIEEIEMKLMVC